MYKRQGKLRLIALGNAERSPLLPDVLTVAEQGVPGYDYASMFGYMAPAGLPAAIVNKLSVDMAKAARSPDIVKRLETEGGIPIGNTPAQFAQLLSVEINRYRKLVDELGIKPEE